MPPDLGWRIFGLSRNYSGLVLPRRTREGMFGIVRNVSGNVLRVSGKVLVVSYSGLNDSDPSPDDLDLREVQNCAELDLQDLQYLAGRFFLIQKE